MANRVKRPDVTKVNPGRKALMGAEIFPVEFDVDQISIPTDYGNIGEADKDKSAVSLPIDKSVKLVAPKKGDDTPGGGW